MNEFRQNYTDLNKKETSIIVIWLVFLVLLAVFAFVFHLNYGF